MPLGLGKVVILEYIKVVGFICREQYWYCRFRVKEESLEEGAKSSVGVNCERDEDHVACEEVADYCVTNCNGACGWDGFVVASNLLFFIFL